jgi:4'-phosphopantetheinyl transferase
MQTSALVRNTNNVDVYILYRDTRSLDSGAVELAEQHLSIEERGRRDRLHFKDDRRDFIIAHDLLRRALSWHADVLPTDWRFATTDLGKPSIESTDPRLRALSFSLSHTRGCVACAITGSAPVGIDVESIGQSQLSQRVADRFFSEEESSWLRRCPDDLRGTRFTELWTLKEAFLKATGVGLGKSLADFSFRMDDHNRIEFSAPSGFTAGEWHFALFEPFSNVRLAVAVYGVRPRLLMQGHERNGHTLAPLFMSMA